MTVLVMCCVTNVLLPRHIQPYSGVPVCVRAQTVHVAMATWSSAPTIRTRRTGMSPTLSIEKSHEVFAVVTLRYAPCDS
jgi:hypothetical protein